jgi:hypothetical protein
MGLGLLAGAALVLTAAACRASGPTVPSHAASSPATSAATIPATAAAQPPAAQATPSASPPSSPSAGTPGASPVAAAPTCAGLSGTPAAAATPPTNPGDLLRQAQQILGQLQAAGGSANCSYASSSSSTGSIAVTLVATATPSEARASVQVTDAAGHGVSGAQVQGSVQGSGTGQTRPVSFPPTDADGRSSAAVPLGGGQGTTVTWSVRVSAGGSTISTSTTSTVP